MGINWINRYFFEVFCYFLFFFFAIGLLPPPVIAGICIVYGFINYLFTAKGNLSNFILFFVASLFYNAFHELIFGKEFSRNESSVVMANVSNWMGLLYVGQLLLSGQFNSKNFQWTRIDSILTLFMIVLVFTSVIGWDFSHSLKELGRYPSFIGFYIVTRISINTREKVFEMLSVFYASIIIVFSITIYKGLIGQQYGALVDFIFILPPIIHLKINELSYLKSKVVTIFSIVFLAIGSFSFLISDSRRILISISIVWLSTLVGKQKIVSIFAILVTFFIFSKFVDGLDYDFRYENSFSQFSNLLAGSAQEEEVDKFTTGRSQLWGAGINLILNNPIFGVGLSNHVVLLPTYGGYTEIRIHNIFLDLTAQTGILGLIVFLMLIYNLIQHLLKYKKNFKDLGLEINTKFVNSLLISLITVLIFAIFGGSFILERWGWFQIGFILSSLHAFNLKIK